MNYKLNKRAILGSECIIVPDVLGAVGEPHSVMPVARTAAAAAVTVAVKVVVVAAVRVTHVPAAAAAADPKGRLLGLVAPPEIDSTVQCLLLVIVQYFEPL